jgi:hypothetical protein
VIQDAIDQSAAGATIWVLPGTYGPGGAEHVVLATTKLVCLRSVQGPTVTTLDGKGLGTVVRAGYEGALWIEGFTIRGAGPDGSDVLDGYGVGMGGWSELRGWVVGNVFEDNVLGQGALAFSSSTIDLDADVLISGNVFRHNTAPDWESTVLMDFPGPEGDTGLVRIENNVIADNGSNGLSFFQMLEFSKGPWPLRIEVVNNTITRNAKGLVAPVDGIFVHNNIIAGNDEDVFRLEDGAGTSVLNNLFGSAPPFVGVGGNMDGDPEFVAPDLGDFHLQPGSPARHAGTPKLAPSVDIEGHDRNPSQPDLGAFESP